MRIEKHRLAGVLAGLALVALMAWAAACGWVGGSVTARPPQPGAYPTLPGDEGGAGEAMHVDNTIEVDQMLRAYCYAGSNITDHRALGGFGGSDNVPKRINFSTGGRDRCYLLAQPGVVTEIGDAKGMRLLLVNPTRRVLEFDASDSRLSIVQEAKDETGAWRPIEYLPASWCGNSYHRVFLGPQQYWAFPAPRYAGPMETTLRFRLNLGDGKAITSNEFAGSIHPGQFEQKQPHQPTDLMDPYPVVE